MRNVLMSLIMLFLAATLVSPAYAIPGLPGHCSGNPPRPIPASRGGGGIPASCPKGCFTNVGKNGYYSYTNVPGPNDTGTCVPHPARNPYLGL
jgi:hypothetical protein